MSSEKTTPEVNKAVQGAIAFAQKSDDQKFLETITDRVEEFAIDAEEQSQLAALDKKRINGSISKSKRKVEVLKRSLNDFKTGIQTSSYANYVQEINSINQSIDKEESEISALKDSIVECDATVKMHKENLAFFQGK